MERRFAPRVALALPIIAVARDGTEFWGKIWNISSGGAGFSTSRGALLTGDKVEVYLELPGEEGLQKFTATVTWTKSAGENGSRTPDQNRTSDGARWLTTTAAGLRFLEEDAAHRVIKAIKYILRLEKERITKIRKTSPYS